MSTPDPAKDEQQVQAFARLVDARDHPVKPLTIPAPDDPRWIFNGDPQ